MTGYAAALLFAIVIPAVTATHITHRNTMRRRAEAEREYRERRHVRDERRSWDLEYRHCLNMAAMGVLMEAQPYDQDGYCECGAHVKGTPCYLPDLRDDWSRRARPALTSVKGGQA